MSLPDGVYKKLILSISNVVNVKVQEMGKLYNLTLQTKLQLRLRLSLSLVVSLEWYIADAEAHWHSVILPW